MTTIPATRFRQRCFALLGNLDPEGLVITRRGTPVARVVPLPPDPRALIGSLARKIRINGDILSTGLRFDARRAPRRRKR